MDDSYLSEANQRTQEEEDESEEEFKDFDDIEGSRVLPADTDQTDLFIGVVGPSCYYNTLQECIDAVRRVAMSNGFDIYYDKKQV